MPESGYLPRIMGAAEGLGTPLPIISDVVIPEPSENTLSISKVALSDAELSYGSLLSWTNVFANDFALFADGINPLQLYNNGSRTYRASVVAPNAALTATSEAGVNSTMRPTSNEAGIVCGVAESLSYTTHTWVDDSGTEYTRATYPSQLCNNYLAVDEVVADDTGYVVFTELQNYGVGVSMFTRWRLSSLTYTPSSGYSASLRIRLKYDEVGSPAGTTTFKVHLYQGHPVSDATAVLIHTTSYTEGDLSTSWQDKDITVTTGETANITDWTKLYIVCELASNAGPSDYRNVYVSQAYLTATTAGSVGLAAGVYTYVYTYVRSATGAESGPSPELQYTHSTTGPVMLNDLTFSDDSTVDYINIYRTVKGGAEFHLIRTVPNDEDEAIPNPTEGLEDAIQDTTLTGANAIILDIDRKRVYEALLPPKVRYLATYKNRVFGGGAILDAPYEAGTASFTKGSTTVTGTGTYWTSALEGRVIRSYGAPPVEPKGFFKPGGAIDPYVRRSGTVSPLPVVRERQQTYRIAKVNSKTSITLTQAFEDDSAVGDYQIVDDRNPFQLSWSAAGFPEDWPVSNGVEIPSDSGDGITGIVPHLGALYVFTRDRIYRFSGDDESNFRVDMMFQGTGCVSGHTVKVVNNRIFFQGEDGWYSYDGAADPFPISAPPMQDSLARGIERTAKTVNGSRARMAVAEYDHDYKVIHTWNSLGTLENSNAVIYDTTNGSWSVDDSPDVVSAGWVYGPEGDRLLLAGDVLGNVWQLNVGNSDGVWSGTVVADITSASQTTLVCSGASFYTDGYGLWGVPVYLLSSDGDLTRTRALTNDGTSISLMHVLDFTPTTSYQVIVGAIPFEYSTGHVNYGAPHKPKVLEYVEWVYEPTSNQGELYCLVSEDFGDLGYVEEDSESGDVVATVDLTGIGIGRIFTRARGNHIRVMVRSFVPGHDVKLVSMQHFLLFDQER